VRWIHDSINLNVAVIISFLGFLAQPKVWLSIISPPHAHTSGCQTPASDTQALGGRAQVHDFLVTISNIETKIFKKCGPLLPKLVTNLDFVTRLTGFSQQVSDPWVSKSNIETHVRKT
jgi:hypothetical protein